MTFHELGHTSVVTTRPWWLRPTHLNPTHSQLYLVPLLCPLFPDWRSSCSQIIDHSPSPSDNGQQVCRRCLLCQVKLETILSPMITLCFCYGRWTYIINLVTLTLQAELWRPPQIQEVVDFQILHNRFVSTNPHNRSVFATIVHGVFVYVLNYFQYKNEKRVATNLNYFFKSKNSK